MFGIMHVNQLFQSNEAWGHLGQLLMVYHCQVSNSNNITLINLSLVNALS